MEYSSTGLRNSAATSRMMPNRLGLQLPELRRQAPGGAGGAHALTPTDA